MQSRFGVERALWFFNAWRHGSVAAGRVNIVRNKGFRHVTRADSMRQVFVLCLSACTQLQPPLCTDIQVHAYTCTCTQ